MTKTRNGRAANSKRKANPMTIRVPRIRMKERNNRFDGQYGNFRSVHTPLTATANVAAQLFFVDCDSTGAMGSVGSSIATLYNEFVYESLTMRWLPLVAPGVADGGSQIYIAYIDNPEKMSVLLTLTDTQALAAVKAIKNAKFFNAWEQATYSVPLTRRRPKFDVNITNGHTDDENDRSTQGMVIVAAESLTATPILGHLVSDSCVKFTGLSVIAS